MKTNAPLGRTLLVGAWLAIASPALAQNAPPVPMTDARGLPTLAPMLAQVTPAVVNIAVLQAQAADNPLLRDPFFRRFFEQERREPQLSAGSGVIIDARQGLVLTNNHVIANAQTVMITLKDRRQLEAKLVGADPGTDIALLRVAPERLAALPLGDSDALSVGDYVVAIGNPFGIGQTVTSGIVSALGRSGLGMDGYEDFIQTDASINPGNSGGALVNLRGELIGINTAIIGPAGGNVGIGFAVPINMARAVTDQLLKFGEVRRGKLGVASADLTPDVARQLGVAATEGALIVQVEAKSPAAVAGLRPKDIVVAANGRPVRGSGDLRNRIGLTPVGEEIALGVLRDGRPLQMSVRVAELFRSTTLGANVPQLTGARAADIEQGNPLRGMVEGALITAIDLGSAAAAVGLKSGDIVVGVNRRRVRSVADLVKVLRELERPWRLSVLRGEARIGLVIR